MSEALHVISQIWKAESLCAMMDVVFWKFEGKTGLSEIFYVILKFWVKKTDT